MKTITQFALIFALALSVRSVFAQEPSAGLVNQFTENDRQLVHDLIAERDSLRSELEATRAALAPLDAYLTQSVNTLLACAADTIAITEVKPAKYREAIADYEDVKPIMQYYNPYSGHNLDNKAKKLRIRLEKAEKVAKAKALLSGKSSEAEVKANMAILEPLKTAKDLTEADRKAVKQLYEDIQKDYNWGNIFKSVLSEMTTWELLPDAKMAQLAYEKIVVPRLLNKIAEVYPGKTMLPGQFVKLNTILNQLTDATLNYSKSKYRVKVSSEAAFKVWIKQLADSL